MYFRKIASFYFFGIFSQLSCKFSDIFELLFVSYKVDRIDFCLLSVHIIIKVEYKCFR